MAGLSCARSDCGCSAIGSAILPDFSTRAEFITRRRETTGMSWIERVYMPLSSDRNTARQADATAGPT
ncbi:hypothetical protein FAIPA1_100017 [Frankia sp. AiPs1]